MAFVSTCTNSNSWSWSKARDWANTNSALRTPAMARRKPIGTVKFNQNGDVTSNPVTIYKIKGGKSTTLKVIVPNNSLVAAA